MSSLSIEWLLFRPDFHLAKLEDMLLCYIIKNYRVVIIDIDNTLVKHGVAAVSYWKKCWTDILKANKVKVVLMTNNYNGEHIQAVIKMIEPDFVVTGRWPAPWLWWNPFAIMESLFVQPMWEAAEKFDVDQSQTIVFNDSMIIIYAARVAGCGAAVLVEPIDRQAEKSSTMIRFGRLIERHIIEPRLEKL